MTGLDPDKDVILEVFCLITDGNLNLVDETGFGTVIHQPQSRLDEMDDWCKATHGASGLSEAVVKSDVTAQEAADQLLAYIKKYVPNSRRALLAGNSVHVDR